MMRSGSAWQAAEMATRLGRPELESAALDAVHACTTDHRGLYGQALQGVQRRLERAPSLDDIDEVGDIYAMAAWTQFHMGNYRQSCEHADEGIRRTIDNSANGYLHCLTWGLLARVRLGEWQRFDDGLADAERLLGEHRESPPPFARGAFAAAVLMHELRGDGAAADALMARLDRLHGGQAPPSPLVPWIARFLSRRGLSDRAESLALEALRGRAASATRGVILEARCDLTGDAGRWDRAPELIADARSWADHAQLVALPLFADRLEGRAQLAGGETHSAIDSLRLAAAGFHQLGARWDAANTDMWLTEVLLESSQTSELHALLESATSVFGDLGTAREASHSHALLRRAGAGS